MAKFAKEILREGTFEVSTLTGRKTVTFTKEDFEKYRDTSNKMLQSGIKISGPWKHITKGQFVPPVEEVSQSPDPADNAGFWENFYVSQNSDGRYSFYGVIDCPGDQSDPNSPAYKVGKTVKDTSIGALPGFRDGRGFDWGSHAIAHIALPLDPVEPGQSNFVPLPDGKEYLTIAMSRMISADGGALTEVLTLLKEKGIELPTDTSVSNFIDRLKVALMQKSSDKNPVSQKPTNSKAEVYPVMLSLTQDQKKAIIAAGVINPATQKPFDDSALAEVDSKTESDLKASITMMSNLLRNERTEKYKQRIALLVASGRINQAYADAQLLPLLGSYQMQIDGDKLSTTTPLDVTLNALEQIPLPATAGQQVQQPNSGLQIPGVTFMGTIPANAQKQSNPDTSGQANADVSAIVNAVLNSAPSNIF